VDTGWKKAKLQTANEGLVIVAELFWALFAAARGVTNDQCNVSTKTVERVPLTVREVKDQCQRKVSANRAPNRLSASDCFGGLAKCKINVYDSLAICGGQRLCSGVR
jgi:hypothetical protein